MSKVEIEDVLSSIRRLVSEDNRPSIVRGGPSLERRDMTQGPERLILTPALRVVAEEPAPIPPMPEPPVSAIAPIGALVAGLGAAVDAQHQDWEPETGDELPPLPEGVAALDDAEWEGEGPTLTFAAYPRVQLTNPILRTSPVARPQDSADTLTSDMRETEAAAPEVLVSESLAADPWTSQPEIIAAPVEDTEAQPDVADWAQEGDDGPYDSLSRNVPTIEPDAAWADAAEAEAVEELTEQVANRLDPAEAAGLTPEALREMVRQLLVEELQGALGQRITRNIRKLVRAEIARAMATEQLC